VIAALRAALNPFLTYYAQETADVRVNAMIGLPRLHAFLHRVRTRDRRLLPAFVAAMTTMLYTHNWAIFVGIGTVVGRRPARAQRGGPSAARCCATA
jgi:hypothetical protein